MSTFDELVEQLRTLTRLVATRAPTEAASVYRLPRWTFERHTDNALVVGQTIEDRCYWRHTNLHEWLASLEPYSRIAELLDCNEHMRRWAQTRVTGPDPDSARRVGLNAIIRDLVTGALEIGVWRISEARWQRTVTRLRLLLQGRMTHHLLAFLHGLAVADSITVGSVLLRPPERSELLEAYNFEMSGGPNAPIISCEAVLDGCDETALGTRSNLADQAGSVVAALRIWTRDPIVPIATYEAEGRDALFGSIQPTTKLLPLHIRPRPLSDVPGFVAFYDRVRNILLQPPKSLGVALRRLQLMVEQERSSDRMLDIFIILEALLLQGEKSEIAYRLALRAAHFAGDDRASRAAVRKMVKDGYDLRSRIAHGAASSGTDQELQTKLENLLYTVLRRYSERATERYAADVHKTIIDEIEGQLLERSSDV